MTPAHAAPPVVDWCRAARRRSRPLRGAARPGHPGTSPVVVPRGLVLALPWSWHRACGSVQCTREASPISDLLDAEQAPAVSGPRPERFADPLPLSGGQEEGLEATGSSSRPRWRGCRSAGPATGSRRSSRRGRSRSACIANDRLRHMRAPTPGRQPWGSAPEESRPRSSPALFVSGCSTPHTSSPIRSPPPEFTPVNRSPAGETQPPGPSLARPSSPRRRVAQDGARSGPRAASGPSGRAGTLAARRRAS